MSSIDISPCKHEMQTDPYLSEYLMTKDLVGSGDPSAIKKMEELAHRGSPMGMIFIADAMRTGSIYNKDVERAEGWYVAAANAGFICSMHELGQMHRETNKYELAVLEFNRAIENGFAPSMNALGLMYFHGEGVERDVTKARSLWI